MMRKIKYIISSLILSTMIFTGCASEQVEQKEVINVKVSSPDGLPTMSIAKMVKEDNQIKENYDIEYSIEKTSETLSTSVMKEEPDIAIVPSNMAAIAYNKTNNYQIAGTTGFGSFYIVSTEDVNNYDDLKDKNIMNIGKGLTPDITAQYILNSRELNTQDLSLSYVNSPSELVPMIVSGKENTAIVPEPALSAMMTKNKEVKIFKSLNDEYKELTDSKYGYPQATIIVKKEFIENNKEFVDIFLDEVDKSIAWSNENPSELANYCEEIGVSTEKPMIEKSIDRANLRFVSIEDNKEEYKLYYENLFESNPKSLGGTMPDEKIFINR